MAIDPATLDSDTPRSLDGRSYPEHLRAYERLDQDLLPLLELLSPATFDSFVAQIIDGCQRAAALRWLSSAEWRGLVERRENNMRGPRRYVVTDRGRRRQRHEVTPGKCTTGTSRCP
jgi:hypothetical protein